MPSSGGQTTNANPRNLSVGGGSPTPAINPSGSPPAYPASTDPVADVGTGHGMLRVVSGSALDAQEAEALLLDQQEEEAERQFRLEGIAGHIRTKYYEFRSTRETRGISKRLLESLRAYRGEYSESQLAEIQKFGGSTVYSRLTALKCRGATAMMRDIYLAGDRPWGVEPTPVPTLPDNIEAAMEQLVQVELAGLQQAGQPIDEEAVKARMEQLRVEADRAAQRAAHDGAVKSTRYLDDMLVEGGFYDTFVEFLHNVSVFPYAFMKGPVVRMATDVQWVAGEAVAVDSPKMFWEAPSPFDVYWQTGAGRFEDAEVIEHLRLTRHQLNNLLGVPGYNDDAIREVLLAYGNGGLSDWLDYTDSERARLEQREDPHVNQSDMIDTLEYHGWIQGRMLLNYGYDADEIPDEATDYFCTAWLVDRYVIKAQIDPNPRKRHPYYMTSFEKVPGAIVGHGIAEILNDVTGVANATLRSLVNNLSMASGPQVEINDDRRAPGDVDDSMYPWKRWHVLSDPMGSNDPAIRFFQPKSNAQELLAVYQQMTVIADEVSSIPRYMTGSASAGSGAGRTASGLSMLMSNASKVMQSVAANIDNDIFKPLLQRLYDTVLLTTGTEVMTGDEQIQVRGVVFANQRETERARMLEFLQLTGNPIDAQIVGPQGRAELLREVADRIGLDYAKIVPDDTELKQQAAQQQMQQMQQGQMPGKPGGGEAGRPEEGLRASNYGPSGQAV